MVRHILLIQFNTSSTMDEIETVRDEFLIIKNKIEGIVDVEWGENNSPEGLNKNYSHCVLMTFKNNAARDAYLPHPAHEALKTIFKPTLKDIIVFDFTNVESTDK